MLIFDIFFSVDIKPTAIKEMSRFLDIKVDEYSISHNNQTVAR